MICLRMLCMQAVEPQYGLLQLLYSSQWLNDGTNDPEASHFFLHTMPAALCN